VGLEDNDGCSTLNLPTYPPLKTYKTNKESKQNHRQSTLSAAVRTRKCNNLYIVSRRKNIPIAFPLPSLQAHGCRDEDREL